MNHITIMILVRQSNRINAWFPPVDTRYYK